MSKYNYAALSPQDFEEIIRDLLQAEWNVLIEAFRTGRDSGIDLRYAATPERSVIVQCKHYMASGFDKLLAPLGAVELPKVQRLAPARYVLATTVALTPANKDKIVETLAPFVRSTGDVLGADDVDGLLSRHAEIERANFKLWLTSTSVLQRILTTRRLRTPTLKSSEFTGSYRCSYRTRRTREHARCLLRPRFS